jgi:hypothetical protein
LSSSDAEAGLLELTTAAKASALTPTSMTRILSKTRRLVDACGTLEDVVDNTALSLPSWSLVASVQLLMALLIGSETLLTGRFAHPSAAWDE